MEHRLQNITLVVDGITIPLSVVPEEEPIYRKAGAELSARISAYQASYPKLLQRDPCFPLALSALDRAYYAEKNRELNDTTVLVDTLTALNNKVDDFIASLK